jgi:cell division protein FtsN
MVGPGTARVRIRVVGNEKNKGRYFTLQVAAYADESSARALRRELDRDYPKVRIESSGGMFRVLVGRFDKEKKARKVEERLRQEGREVLMRTEDGP